MGLQLLILKAGGAVFLVLFVSKDFDFRKSTAVKNKEDFGRKRGRPEATGRWVHALSLSAESFIQAIAEWFDLRIGDYDAPVYRREVRVNSDYRRSDDVLRMVFDCTSAQRHAIELAAAHDRGDIVYGMYRSDSALMTCFLFGLKDLRHLHFIDGTDGGFTFAARAMKAQIAVRTDTP